MNAKNLLLPVAIAAVLTAAPAFASAPWAGTGTTQAPDADEAAALTFMREEEKLARDVYVAMNALWDSALFENISLSEQQHTDTVKSFLDKYALPDPATPDQPGVYMNSELQQLYSDLSARGEQSYAEALQVGGLIEEVDIEDLQDAIAGTDNADLKRMYENLQRGSRNHLRAYVSELERLGIVYTAQHLDQATVDAIVDSPMERGGRASVSDAATPDLAQGTATGCDVVERGGGSGRGGQGNGSGGRQGKGTCSGG